MSTKRISIAEVMLWIFVIILILLSLTPFALGFKIKSDYSRLIGEISEILQIDVKIQQYDQGLFSSESTLLVKLPNMEKPVQFKEEIVHGPVYFGLLSQGQSPLVAAVVKGQLDVSPDQQAMVQKVFSGNKPVAYQYIVDFTGDVSAQTYIPSVNTTFESEDGPVSIQSSGLILNERYLAASGQLSGEVKTPGFKMRTSLYTISADSINMSFSGTMGENQILIGDSVISMSSFNIDSGEEQFALRDLTVRSVTSENGNLINSSIDIHIGEILASNQKFGPVQFVFNLDGISAQSLNQLQLIQNEVAEMHEKGRPPEQINSMMTGQIMGIIPDLIKQAEIKIKPLTVNSELGKLEADLGFTLKGIDADTPADPIFLLGAVSMDLNISIDEPLLKQFISWELQNSEQANFYKGSEKSKKTEVNVPLEQKVAENIQGMLDENWLRKNEGKYLSKISMHEGELLINEKSVDPMQQIMSTMGSSEQQ